MNANNINSAFETLCNFIDELDCFDGRQLSDILKVEDFNGIDDANELYDALTYSEYVFNADVIYYSDAMKILTQEDPTLTDSLEIAAEYGYKPGDINSCLLASLLQTRVNEQRYWDASDEITELIEALNQAKESAEILAEAEEIEVA